MSSNGSSKGKTKSSRAMERLKNHNTSPPRPSDSARNGAKSSRCRPGQHSKTTTSSRRQVSEDSSPERRPSKTRILDEYQGEKEKLGSALSATKISQQTKMML